MLPVVSVVEAEETVVSVEVEAVSALVALLSVVVEEETDSTKV